VQGQRDGGRRAQDPAWPAAGAGQSRGRGVAFFPGNPRPGRATGFDLVVVSDGANSRLRGLFTDDFDPSAVVASAKFIWFGTTCLFDGLTFIHAHGPHGVFAAHAYPISGELSTFVVETDEGSWASAGLDEFDPATPPGPSDERTRAYLEKLFAPEIGGHALVGNNSRWANFATRRARTWRRVAAGGPALGAARRRGAHRALLRRIRDEDGDGGRGRARPRACRWARHRSRPGGVRGSPPAGRGADPGRGTAEPVVAPLDTPFHARAIALPGRRLAAERCPAGTVWIDAPGDEADLPAALEQVRAAARAGAPLIGARGGIPLTRVLVSEQARLAGLTPSVMTGPYDDDEAHTLVLSGRADLVAVTA
jgi:salicyloyl-CoA 5-hydroxylase